jgi:MFS family permease
MGGLIASRITNFRLAASFGLFVTGITTVLIGSVDLGALLLIGVMSAAGFCSGIVMPSRDMIVRESTPPGAFGKVFGFVTNGFNIAGIIAPLLFGALLDHGEPRVMFFVIAVFMLLSIVTVVCVPRRRAAP